MMNIFFKSIVNYFSQKSLKPMIYVLAVFSLITVCGLTGLYIARDYYEALSKEKSNLQNYCNLISMNIETILNESSTFLKVTDVWMNDNPGKDPRTDPSYKGVMRTLCKEIAPYVDVRFVSDNGMLSYIGDSPDTIRADVSDREYYKAQLDERTKGLFVAKSVKSRVTKIWGIPMSYPLSENKYKLKLVFAAVELPVILDAWGKILPVKSSLITLARRNDGVVLATVPFDEKRQGFSLAGGEVWEKRLLESDSGVVILKKSILLNHKRILAWKSIDRYSLVITTSMSFSDALERWRINTAITVIVIVLLGLIIVFLYGRVFILLKKIKENEEHLQILNSTKDKLFSIISHDLRGFSGTQMSLIQILKEQHKTIDEEKREYIIDRITSISNKTKQLLDNLLTWSKSQMGLLVLHPEMFNLKILCDEILGLLSESAHVKKIMLRNDVPITLEAEADVEMIKTVIRNLISNSIKYTRENGMIVVHAEREPGRLRVSVEDNGVGMSADIRAKLFKIGAAESTPGTNHEKGSGLGLLLCKDFVGKHNGSISVESVPGEGSTFTFTIPQPEF